MKIDRTNHCNWYSIQNTVEWILANVINKLVFVYVSCVHVKRNELKNMSKPTLLIFISRSSSARFIIKYTLQTIPY